MKQSNPLSLQRLHAGVFMRGVSTLAIAAFVYVTPDDEASVMTKGYFDNADKYIPDCGLVKIVNVAKDGAINTFDATFTRVTKKATKARPSNFTYEIEKLASDGGPAFDPSEINDKIKALEEKLPAEPAVTFDGEKVKADIGALDKKIVELEVRLSALDAAPEVVDGTAAVAAKTAK